MRDLRPEHPDYVSGPGDETVVRETEVQGPPAPPPTRERIERCPRCGQSSLYPMFASTSMLSCEFCGFKESQRRHTLLHVLRLELQRVTYKPGWRFSIEQAPNGFDLVLRAGAFMQNADQRIGEEPSSLYVSLDRHFPGDFFDQKTDPISLDLFHEFVYRLVVELEMHEVKEFLKIDGKHFIDPHPEQRPPTFRGRIVTLTDGKL